MGNFDKSGTELVSEGQNYTQITAAGSPVTQLIKAGPGRVARINWISGTGGCAVWDNASGAASGNQIWPSTAGAVGVPQIVSSPTNLGITVVVAVTTTVNVIWT